MAPRPRSTGKRKQVHDNEDEASGLPKSKVLKSSPKSYGSNYSAFACFPHEVLVNILTFLLQRPESVKLHSAKARRWKNEVAKLKLEWKPTEVGSLINEVAAVRSEEVWNGEKIQQSPLLNVLLVSRALYYAGIEAFYGSNVFDFETAIALLGFIESHGTDRRKCVRHIDVHMKWYYSHGPCPRKRRSIQMVHSLASCDTDEQALRSDIMADLRNIKKLRVFAEGVRQSRYSEFKEATRMRLERAWPSTKEKIEVLHP